MGTGCKAPLHKVCLTVISMLLAIGVAVAPQALGQASPTTSTSATDVGGGGVHIVRMRYNAPGADSDSRRSLNGERIRIRNSGDQRVSIKGWTIHDAGRDNTYTFPYDVKLRPGEYMVLYTGPGPDLAGSCADAECPRSYFWHWDKNHHVWDNTGDTAVLSRSDGSVVDRCTYTKEDRSPKSCN